MSLYYFGNYRTEEQLAQMRELEAAGVCLFCPEHLPNFRPVVHRTTLWTITTNRFPYRETRLHYLLLPDEHVTDLVDLSPQAQADFWVALGWLRQHHDMRYYGLAVRNGDSAYTGGTIRHLHVHVLQGDTDDPQHQGVRVRLSSRPRDIGPTEVDPD